MQPCASLETLRRLIRERKMKADLLREEKLAKMAQNRLDLAELRDSYQALDAVRKKPWLAALNLNTPERVNKPAWDAYVRRYITPERRVSLPPDDEVDVDLLTEKLLHPDARQRPRPPPQCADGFYPPFGDVRPSPATTRPRALVWGALIPNSVLVRLLWTTRTLEATAAARWRRKQLVLRRSLDDACTDGGDNAEDEAELEELLGVPPRVAQYRRGAIGDVSEPGLAAAHAADDTDWALEWELSQPLATRRRRRQRGSRDHRRRRRSSRRRSRRSRGSSLPSSRGSAATGGRSRSDESCAASRDAARRASAGATATRPPPPPLPPPPPPARPRPPPPRPPVRRDQVRTERDEQASVSSEPAVRAERSARRADGADSHADDAGEVQEHRPVFHNICGPLTETIPISMFAGESYEESRKRAAEFMKEFRGRPWLMSLVPDIALGEYVSLGSLPATIIDRISTNNPRLVADAIQGVTQLMRHFSFKHPVSLKRKLFLLLQDSVADAIAFEPILKLLEGSLAVPSDELVPLLLGLYPLSAEATRVTIDAYLRRGGLRDAERRLRRELLSWVAPGVRSRHSADLQVALGRRAAHFLAEWRASYETNASLLAEELRRERLQVRVRADIVRALAKYEPTTVRLEGEQLCLQLAQPPDDEFARAPGAVDVLNYFVEMSEPEAPAAAPPPAAGRAFRPRASRVWRRHNRELVVAPRAGLALRGHPAPSAVLQQPTVLVTHARRGLAPLPWPQLTLSISLRVANKFFYQEPSDCGGDGDT